MKQVGAGERFTTPEAIVRVAQKDSLDIFTRRLVDAGKSGRFGYVLGAGLPIKCVITL